MRVKPRFAGVLSLAVLAQFPLHAKAQGSLPELSISSARLSSGTGAITLRLPAGTVLPRRARVALFEADRPARVAEANRSFTLVNGGLQTTINIENATPGYYDLRVVNNDSGRTALSGSAALVVPGIEREPSWWIFDGSPVVRAATESHDAPALPRAPLFLPGLRRDLSQHPQPVTRDFAGDVPTSWKLWALPTLAELSQPNYDFAALQARLAQQLVASQSSGDVGYVGFSLSTDAAPTDSPGAAGALAPETTRVAIQKIAAIRDAVARDAALIFVTNSSASTLLLDRCVPLCDAVWIRSLPVEADPIRRAELFWTLKTVRRIAEDQGTPTNIDLPIFFSAQHAPESNMRGATMEDEAFSLLVSGATGFTRSAGTEDAVFSDAPGTPDRFARLLQANLSLFVGSVTLEDAAIYPGGNDDAARQFVGRLQWAGRVPQLARVVEAGGDTGHPEAFYVHVDENTSAVTLEALRRTAQAGGRLYIEGAPAPGSPLAARMRELGGGTLTALPAAHQLTVKLDDPWIFGTLHGQHMPVTERATVTLAPTTIGNQARSEQGSDQLTAPRVVATLDDGTPGIILNPIGKGTVLWLPHDFAAPNGSPLDTAASRAALGQNGEMRGYDAAIAGWLGGALVRLRATPTTPAADNPLNVQDVRTSVRRSAKGTLLVGIENTSNRTGPLEVAVDGAPTYCVDLTSGRALPVQTRGYEGRTTVTIPANGYTLLAFALTQRAYDDERGTARLKARMR